MYDFRCTACQTVFDRKVAFEKKDEQTCPECNAKCEQVWNQSAPGLGDPVRLGLVKPSDGFRDVLRNIDKRTPGSQLKYNSSYI